MTRIRLFVIRVQYLCFGLGMGLEIGNMSTPGIWIFNTGLVLYWFNLYLRDKERDDNNKRDIRPNQARRDFPGSDHEVSELPPSDGGNPDLRLREGEGRWN